jgi:drug/metabolite transporter (DMT)-like permease
VLSAAFFFALSLIATKMLTRTVSTFAILLWMNVVQLPMGLVGSDPLFLGKIGLWQLPSVAGVAIAGLASHFCLTNAFRAGEASMVVPLDFLRIPLIALVGWFFYGEPIDLPVFVGAAIIVLGVMWNLRAETRAAPPVAAKLDA